MSVEPETLPVINVEPLFEDNPAAWNTIDETIGNACATCAGFVVVGLPQSTRPEHTDIKKLLSIFDLPQPLLDGIGKKEMRSESKRSFRGYVARRTGGFAYNEIFDIGPEPPVSGPPINNIEVLIESNAWPAREPAPGWREQMINQYKQMEAHGIRLVRCLARYLGVDETAAAARYQNSNSTFRLLKYPERPAGIEIKGEKDAMRVHHGREYPLIGSEHTDNGGLTLLWQDRPGLQFQSPAGDWLDVPDIPDSFSILVGESLQSQSSNRIIATPHRILGRGQMRHSMAFFLEPNLFSSIRTFSKDSNEETPVDEDTYAASMLETLRKTGRA